MVVNTFVEVKYDFLYYYNYMPFSHRCRTRLKWSFYHFKRCLINLIRNKRDVNWNYTEIQLLTYHNVKNPNVFNIVYRQWNRLMGMQNGMPTRKGSATSSTLWFSKPLSLNLLLPQTGQNTQTGTSKTHHCSTTCSNSMEKILIPTMDTLNKPWYTDTMRYYAVVNR